MRAFKSTHKLDFLCKPWHIDPEWFDFKVGTCSGLWRATTDAYEILSVVNSDPGNGHFTDVLEWFEQSCRRDKKHLRIREVWNEYFKQHLITKRGFVEVAHKDDDVIKYFT